MFQDSRPPSGDIQKHKTALRHGPRHGVHSFRHADAGESPLDFRQRKPAPMSLSRQSPPAALVITTDALAEHLRLPHAAPETEQTTELTTLIRAATSALERRLDAAFIAQTWQWRTEVLTAPFPLTPVISVETVELVAPDGARATWTGWSLAQGMPHPHLIARSTPTLATDGYAEIRFTAGYGTTADALPEDLRQAVTLLAAHFYENREATTDSRTPLPLGVASLLAPYRPIRLS